MPRPLCAWCGGPMPRGKPGYYCSMACICEAEGDAARRDLPIQPDIRLSPTKEST